MARFCTRENEPLKKWNGIPIYLATILAAVLTAGFLFCAVLQSLRSPLMFRFMFILPGDVLNVFSAFTYPLIDKLNFFTPFFIFFFYWLAVGIETHLGRAVLTRLLLLIVLIPVAIACVMWWGFGVSSILAGNMLLSVGVMIAFATLYPNADAFGWIPFKFVAFVCLICGSMMELADHDWVSLIGLWGLSGAAFLYIRNAVEMDHDDYVPVFARVKGFFAKKPKLRVMAPPVPTARPTPVRANVTEEVDLEVDALLDKIAKSGLNSLSSRERAKLEKARQELLKKEQA